MDIHIKVVESGLQLSFKCIETDEFIEGHNVNNLDGKYREKFNKSCIEYINFLASTHAEASYEITLKKDGNEITFPNLNSSSAVEKLKEILNV